MKSELNKIKEGEEGILIEKAKFRLKMAEL
jgi:hypothetical protein